MIVFNYSLYSYFLIIVTIVFNYSCNDFTIRPIIFLLFSFIVCLASLARVTGRFGQDPFRPQFLAETSLISRTFRPQNVNDSANKYERFGQINYIAAEM